MGGMHLPDGGAIGGSRVDLLTKATEQRQVLGPNPGGPALRAPLARPAV